MASRRRARLKPNDPCLCGSGVKYKRCCRGKVDWAAVGAAGEDAIVRNLCARGKNLYLYGILGDALQLDRLESSDWDELKRAVTPAAVRKIHEGVATLWPDLADLARVLGLERERTSGLYVGSSHPRTLLRGLTRHSLYTETILVIDPFVHPRLVTRHESSDFKGLGRFPRDGLVTVPPLPSPRPLSFTISAG